MTRVSKPQRILLVEDHYDQALLVGRWLMAISNVEVSYAEDGESALAKLEESDFDLMLSDILLPGVDGIEVVRRAKQLRPLMISALLTAHGSLDYSMQAIQSGVADLLLKPLRRETFQEKIRALLLKASQMRRSVQQTVLAIGAHPDDVEIGCGGILLRHISRGDRVKILTLTGGEAGGVVSQRAAESERATRAMGAELTMATLEDTKVSAGNGTIELISSVIQELQPDVVYTHTIHDTHQDHRSAHQATLVAARQTANVFCYQSPSSTTAFRPLQFVDIGQFLNRKLQLIESYTSQTQKCAYLEPGLLRATARYWGRFAGYRYVEPLEVIRSIDYRLSDTAHHEVRASLQ